MSDMFRSVGLYGNDPDHVHRALALLTSARGTPLPHESGKYLYVKIGKGVEVWGHVDAENAMRGVVPHFSGLGKLAGRIVGHWPVKPMPSLGRVVVQSQPVLQTDTHYPFVVNVPDYHLVVARFGPEKPAASQQTPLVDLQVAVFAHLVECYDSEDAWRQAQNPTTPRPRMAYPSGMFDNLEQIARDGPAPIMAFIGTVLACEQRRHSPDQPPFQWIHLDTEGGTVDVVAEPADLRGQPRIGGIVALRGMLSARLCESPAEERRRVRRDGRRPSLKVSVGSLLLSVASWPLLPLAPLILAICWTLWRRVRSEEPGGARRIRGNAVLLSAGSTALLVGIILVYVFWIRHFHGGDHLGPTHR